MHKMVTKSSASGKIYDGQTKQMYFLIKGDKLFGKYNTIWHKFCADIKKNLIASRSTIKNL